MLDSMNQQLMSKNHLLLPDRPFYDVKETGIGYLLFWINVPFWRNQYYHGQSRGSIKSIFLYKVPKWQATSKYRLFSNKNKLKIYVLRANKCGTSTQNMSPLNFALHKTYLFAHPAVLDLDFIQIFGKVFHYSCWFGIVGSGRPLWKAWSVAIFFMLVVVEAFAIVKVIRALAGWAVDVSGNRSVTSRLAGSMFYANSILALVFTSRLAISWKKLEHLWIAVERAMTLNIPPDATLKKRMILVIVFVSVCSCTEHLMSIISQVDFHLPVTTILKQYTLNSHGFLFQQASFSYWLAFPLLFISNIATILWNFQDLIIILISMGLTSRYGKLNQFVAKLCAIERQQHRGSLTTEPIKVYTWRKIREAYVKQAMLVRQVDGRIGAIIMLSCFVNFYFICLQLFLGITQGLSGGFLKQSYYIVSLLWLLMRLGGVVLAAADVNTHSKLALQSLHNCQFKYYNVEVDRLQNQLTKDYVALSGLGFFTLTKTILLQMAGAVVTYELVLIQFDDKGPNEVVNTTKL